MAAVAADQRLKVAMLRGGALSLGHMWRASPPTRPAFVMLLWSSSLSSSLSLSSSCLIVVAVLLMLVVDACVIPVRPSQRWSLSKKSCP